MIGKFCSGLTLAVLMISSATHAETTGAKVNPALDLAANSSDQIPLQIRTLEDFPDLTDGYAIFQGGARVQRLEKKSFDAKAPFCYFDLANTDQKGRPAPILKGLVIPAKVQPQFTHAGLFGQIPIHSDAISLTLEDDSAPVEISCHWPKARKDAAIPIKTSFTVSDISSVVGNLFQIEHSQKRKSKSREEAIRFEANTSLVFMEAAVVDVKSSQFLSSLHLGDFELTEGCDPQTKTNCEPIKVHKFGLSKMSDGNVHFILAPDLSGSTTGDRPLIEAAMKRFVMKSKKTDSFSLIPFDGSAQVFMQRTHDRTRAQVEISRMMTQFGGGTNITSAVESASREANSHGKGARNVLVLITDGEDGYDYKQLAAQAILSNMVIFAIDVRGNSSYATNLQGLAEATGGFYLYANGYQNLASELDRLMSIWGAYYFFEYYGKPPQEGKIPNRVIRVKWNDPVTVYASRGFHGPQVQGIGSKKAEIENSELNERIEAEYRKRKADYQALDIFSKADRAATLSDVKTLFQSSSSDGDIDVVAQRAIDLLTSFAEFEELLSSDAAKVSRRIQPRLIEMMISNIPKLDYLKLQKVHYLKLMRLASTAEQYERIARALMSTFKSSLDYLELLNLNPGAGSVSQDEAVRLSEIKSQLVIDGARNFAACGPSSQEKSEYLKFALSAEGQFAIERNFLKSALSGSKESLTKLKASVKSQAEVPALISKLLRLCESPKDVLSVFEAFPNESPASVAATRPPLILGSVDLLKALRFTTTDIAVVLTYVPRAVDRIRLLQALDVEALTFGSLIGTQVTSDDLLRVLEHLLPKAKSKAQFVAILKSQSANENPEVQRTFQAIQISMMGAFQRLPGQLNDFKSLFELCRSGNCKERVKSAARMNSADSEKSVIEGWN